MLEITILRIQVFVRPSVRHFGCMGYLGLRGYFGRMGNFGHIGLLGVWVIKGVWVIFGHILQNQQNNDKTSF